MFYSINRDGGALPWYLWFFLSIAFVNCRSNSAVADIPPLEFAYLSAEKKINPRLLGVWRSVGSGYLLDATGDSILLYSYTRHYSYKEKNDYLESLLNTQAQFTRKGDSLHLYLTDFGEKTRQLQAPKHYVKMERLPADHMSYPELLKLSPPVLFDLFLETLEDNYAFSRERGMDWKRIRQQYAGRINEQSTREDLFQLMGEVVTLTGDHHTKIIADDGRRLQYSLTPSATLVQDAFQKQSQVRNLNTYYSQFFATQYRNISDSLLHGRGQKAANGKLEWGSLSPQIGYIQVHALTGFAGNELSRKQHIDSLSQAMANIIQALQDKAAIVVDVSFNFGGYDAAGLTIAGYFTDVPVPVYTIEVFDQGAFPAKSLVSVIPANGPRFTKPVYLLTSDISRSAAESFAMQMQALPNVQLVGTNTLGILSNMLGKSIGPFYLTCSNERYVASDGKIYEVSGVVPDIPLEIFQERDVFSSHKMAVRQLLERIDRQ